jgi:GTP-binding protein EngB required for normal cell division
MDGNGTRQAEQLKIVASIILKLKLTSLLPALGACHALSGDTSPLDVAVLGQFKSGKSTLLNAVLGESVFPVGALPVTAVITRVSSGPERMVRVIGLDGSTDAVPSNRLAEFVTEAGNPENRRRVSVVDVFTPAMRELPGVRLVDTPGLGSVFTHNTDATRRWLPNVAVALVTVSAERPLSEEDQRLVADARQSAPRVVVVLTKVDLLTDSERVEVTHFLRVALSEKFGVTILVLPFSVRSEASRWLAQLRDLVLQPVAKDVAGERRNAWQFKLSVLATACHGYLEIGLRAAERGDADRDRLRAAVLDESANQAILHDELRLAEQRVIADSRAAFEKLFLARVKEVQHRLSEDLALELQSWPGNLAQQGRQYETWMANWLAGALEPLSRDAAPLADDRLGQAESRLRRIIEAFRDRISRNVSVATGVTVSIASWEVRTPLVAAAPVAVSKAFMLSWDLLWWLLPMWLVGKLFRRHLLGLIPWEVEKNLTRLAADWSEAVNMAVADLRSQAAAWIDTELATLEHLLSRRTAEAAVFRDALSRLKASGVFEQT